MKVKEEYSKEFNEDTSLLKKIGTVELREYKKGSDLPYSTFIIRDEAVNETFVNISIPNPKEKDSYKDIFLKYQHGAKNFCLDFLEVLTGQKDDLEKFSKTKQPKEFIYKQEGRSAVIKTIEDDYLFAIIDFVQDTDIALDIADNFIKYFEGEEATFKKAFNYVDSYQEMLEK